ncbi:MAG: hypothetical protein M1832_005604 [Thelocarpon impressellum]|nr:MAG: hypothetical protein M1832_005604 [Thelocarpon impressellum]
MPVELRKRKAPAAPPAPAPPAKKKTKATKPASSKSAPSKSAPSKPATKPAPKSAPEPAVVATTKKAAAAVISKVAGAVKEAAPAAPATNGSGKVAVGDAIALDGFGGEVETQDGTKTTLKKLVDDSKAGIVLFTYPKASTPGCTTQACLFRDSYAPLTATGLSIYGLSTDSPKANASFKTKQNLPYPLLCDPKATLIGAIGLKKAPKGTTRGVFVVDKAGKVLAAEPGGPAATVEVVKKLVGGQNGVPAADRPEDVKAEDKAKAEVAADVADTAAEIDASGTKK